MSTTASKPAHPPVSKMVITAIDQLSNRKGASLQTIKKYIQTNYNTEMDKRMIGAIGRYLKGRKGRSHSPEGDRCQRFTAAESPDSLLPPSEAVTTATMDNSDTPTPNLYSPLGGFGNLRPNQIQSPYLNLSLPDTISSDFIVPEGANRTRGRFELAFSQIGCSIGVGAGIGGATGSFKGLREVTKMNEAISVKRTQLLNYITRNGASVGNTFGIIALLYSAIGVGLSFVQDENDEINTVVAAASTGTLYGALSQTKAMEGIQGSALNRIRMKRAGFGLVGGLFAAAILIITMNQDKYVSKFRS